MTVEMSEYELQRQRNIENNKAVLASLGLDSPVEFRPTRRTVSVPTTKKPVKRVSVEVENEVPTDKTVTPSPVVEGAVRRSGRERKKTVFFTGQESEPVAQEEWEEVEEEEEYERKTRSRGKKGSPQRVVTMPKGRKWDGGNVFGSIPNVHVGQTWEKRCDVAQAGVHRPWVAGIFGSPKIGCFSICLSGGYEDDIDYGDAFVYTGAGGRDLKGTKGNPKNLRSAPQSSDQTLTGSNLALHLNIESRQPVRVVRGFKSDSKYAPLSGYRYDGLYTVETSWTDKGLSGFKVWHFALKRIPGQPPIGQQDEISRDEPAKPRREGLRSGDRKSIQESPSDEDVEETNSEAGSCLPNGSNEFVEKPDCEGTAGLVGNGEETEEEELQCEEAVSVPVSAKRKAPSGSVCKVAKVKTTGNDLGEGLSENCTETGATVSRETETFSTTDMLDIADETLDALTGVSSSVGTDVSLSGQACESQGTVNGCEKEAGGDVARPSEIDGKDGSIGR